jgi:hypothetical protein
VSRYVTKGKAEFLWPAESAICPACGAQSGEPCRTESGMIRGKAHNTRKVVAHLGRFPGFAPDPHGLA